MSKGNLIIAGGAVKKSSDIILGKFIELAGKNPKICVVPTASDDPVDSFNYLKDKFLSLGISTENVVLMPISAKVSNWSDFAGEFQLKYLNGVNAVWFTGGDQYYVLKAFVNADNSDSPCLEKIREIYENGGVIGGTSAGAAIMSDPMISRGGDRGAMLFPIETDYEKYNDKYDEGDEIEPMLVTKGLGFMKNVIIDQHFDTRPRLHRLMSTMDFTQVSHGFGVSEDTALVVSNDEIYVIGSSYVTEINKTSHDEYVIKKRYCEK